MRKAALGKTGLTVTKTALGCLPLQRRSVDDAVTLIRSAYDAGITFYDTARGYSDSEYKLGIALEGIRDQVVIATKTPSHTVEGMKKDLETSLTMLKTDFIDIYQFHNPAAMPTEDSPLYRQMEDFKRQGMIRHIGLTNHSADTAIAAAESGLYETIQYPLSPLSTERDMAVLETCQRLGLGKEDVEKIFWSNSARIFGVE
jgi:aryl-alcohol dehydrogenase-like predicted oxidoreductase